jgi:putative ABC transport system permease protein
VLRAMLISAFVVAQVPASIQAQITGKWNEPGRTSSENVTRSRQLLVSQDRLEQQFKRIGLTLILVRPGNSTGGGEARLTLADAKAMRRELGKSLIAVAPVQQRAYLPATNRTRKWTPLLVGCTPDLQQVRNWKVVAGRFLTAADLKKQASVCLIGRTVQKQFFADGADPLRETIRVGNLQLQVVGILKEKAKGLTGADQDNLILLPITTLQQELVGQQRLTAILTTARSVDQVDQAVQGIRRVLRAQHQVKEGGEDFDVSTVLDLYRLARQLNTKKQGSKGPQDN